MLAHIVEAEYVGDYRIWLRFDDGAEGEVDLAGEVTGPVFQPYATCPRFANFDCTRSFALWSGRMAQISPRSFYGTS